MISNTPDKPCKACGHRWDEHEASRKYFNSKCQIITFKWNEFKIINCACYNYTEMPNLEYLEYLYDKRASR